MSRIALFTTLALLGAAPAAMVAATTAEPAPAPALDADTKQRAAEAATAVAAEEAAAEAARKAKQDPVDVAALASARDLLVKAHRSLRSADGAAAGKAYLDARKLVDGIPQEHRGVMGPELAELNIGLRALGQSLLDSDYLDKLPPEPFEQRTDPNPPPLGTIPPEAR